ncbi:MAG: hypothetical protein ACJAVV_000820 [Alphaproteobacteria bacterium]|jgi:hypothetical protein
MKKNKLTPALTVLLISTFSVTNAHTEESLVDTLQAKDKMLFAQGFDNCDLLTTASLMTEDVEFYHVKSGIDKGKTEFVKTIQNGLCSTGKNKIRRHLIPNSLAVFPMFNNGKLYGAMQTGKYGFALAGEAVTIAPASFTHLWLLGEDEEWRIARVLNYDHY